MKNQASSLITGIEQAIELGVYDDRVPSIRNYAREKQVSISTVQKAFNALKLEGKIYSCPQKGYFIRKTDNDEKSPYGVAIEQIYTGMCWNSKSYTL